ncbi:hypothetical protein Moror_3417 [Moniliophthora roreri MCA 2997]|uniref:Dickkopf N-terminal cysteine-rich domain-containing protein n=1 Tax=Moniliophthora roreri (strain MCA 2997) TaxID=1381753 RepID=V2X368_MONRO|nr:hypothetical protein Moror_3417 [Moniliophthora roreri MCA 2997]KAI3596137.1 hypothetical protein WG66_008974 [Moniliophthora roreri]
MTKASIYLALFFQIHLALAGTVGNGGSCSGSRDHLDPNSHKLITDCSDHYYCTAPQNGTCVPKACRRDEYPFGYSDQDMLPPMCPQGTFCPDEGSGCRAQVAVGQGCQMNRDDQCAPAPGWRELERDENWLGSICLKSVCMYANATFNEPCILESNAYISVVSGQAYNTIISRDNCRSPQLYCDPNSKTCQASKLIGSYCEADAECEQRNCVNGVCAIPPEAPLRISAWQYLVTVLCLVGAMASTLILLIIIHKRHRYYRYRELRQYYFEQLSLRRSIIALHTAASKADPRFKTKSIVV